MQNTNQSCNIGFVGLGVMGKNLALNLADHGYKVAGFDLDAQKVTDVLETEERERPKDETTPRIYGCDSMSDMLSKLVKPRVIVVLVPAGNPVDAVCNNLIEAGLEPDDIVVDCGNSQWTDTIRREAEYKDKLKFFGTAVSGGEVGARFGPSLMPGGDADSWKYLQPMWEAVSAKVDSNGKPIESRTPGKPVTEGEPCTAYLGPNGAGHYVKMVHNGIEYADMQLICEAYHLIRSLLGYEPEEIGKLFERWNKGVLNSYLVEITADILQQYDEKTGAPLVDMILDSAGQKGTGRWTSISATQLGVPAGIVSESVYARALSTLTQEREMAAQTLIGDTEFGELDATEVENAIEEALYCAKICAYAQGFQIMKAAQAEYNWTLNFSDIAKIWRGGCIIRASFLQKIAKAFDDNANLENLLLNDYFANALATKQKSLRKAVILAAQSGIPTPSFFSALAYFDGYRSEVLPANLLQAQRDYFGAHSYERVDCERGEKFHTHWQEDGRPERKV
ncbi:NADP-dependent phosphogluconate dehydrogenase [Marinomonas mediterranea]|jgi:6-phosphogluconate dehydrogenase (decarboxylating) (EC 1.1.1.44)|uniref:6-phosphogluconate dehydrogenase, decarboxylating n=1 Tax=Marinomonas mediterranea (strain ATCC 700492 / JCM 21426 / NBRC 103028 / MMB-1) TaxID=717774 RepID=F2K480_MARM1|nr:NADP-dependent phosphogluconate dehydrogenase [Marinomonas mediterranea]ADZ92521.1 6-phosphogluconate dehydrogenase, decarboxylating [Marinomonas mediterranea MMB-1]WCN10467.1 NADP-dependent phosphogluconate dehydrogenase [Marinomonas mediterranea]WCN18566.1 NADP-dependent phosphogluconate dehydrogenase [Marinomonas mediterranea MMB-1]